MPPGSSEQAAREVLKFDSSDQVDVERLEALSPQAILRIDVLPVDGVGALRAVLVRPAHS